MTAEAERIVKKRHLKNESFKRDPNCFAISNWPWLSIITWSGTMCCDCTCVSPSLFPFSFVRSPFLFNFSRFYHSEGRHSLRISSPMHHCHSFTEVIDIHASISSFTPPRCSSLPFPLPMCLRLLLPFFLPIYCYYYYCLSDPFFLPRLFLSTSENFSSYTSFPDISCLYTLAPFQLSKTFIFSPPPLTYLLKFLLMFFQLY